MANTPTAALKVADRLSRGPRVWAMLCLKSVRTELGIPSQYASARLAGNAVPAAHRHYSWPAPPGYPVIYDAGFYGHIVLAAPADTVWSTDVKRHGGIDHVPESAISHGWGLRPRFWASHLNGVALAAPVVQHAPVPVPVKPGKPVLPKPASHAEAGYPGHPLKFGSRGPAVSAVQTHLKIAVTGIYDLHTIAAVKAYQLKHRVLCKLGLARFADGVTGPSTFKSITGHN